MGSGLTLQLALSGLGGRFGPLHWTFTLVTAKSIRIFVPLNVNDFEFILPQSFSSVLVMKILVNLMHVQGLPTGLKTSLQVI